MSDYVFSRVAPRPELRFSQLEQFTRLDPYGQHQAVWQLCELPLRQVHGPTAFLFRHEWHGDLPVLYVLSHNVPVDRLGLWHIQSKPYAPQLAVGDRLHFTLRANPVVTRNGKRHDVVMDAKQQMQWQHMPPEARPALNALAYDAGTAWLTGRATQHGFALVADSLLVDGYRTHTMRRRGVAPIHVSTLDFSGVLSVTDPARCVQTLYEGLGHAKGFGCGLLLVKRVSTW